jgi:DNA-binding HxlR family transcriptional regulator
MSSASDNIHLTIEERVLVHLHDFVNLRREIVLTQKVTQEGISRAVGVERKHVPRTLKALIEKEFISENVAHVIGKPQRMKTYFLTEKGAGVAKVLKDHVRKVIITVKDGESSPREMRVEEANELAGDSFTLAEVISYVTPEGVLDLEGLRIPRDNGSRNENRHNVEIEIFKESLTQAWRDGNLTRSEKEILRNLRKRLNITDKERMQIEEEVLREIKLGAQNQIVEVYKVVLEQALADGKINEYERAILEKIKERFHIEDLE